MVLKLSSNSINNFIDDKPMLKTKKKTKTFLRKNKKITFEYNENLSNDPLNKYQLCDTKNIQTGLFINLKDDLNIDIKEYLSTDIDDMDYDDAIKKDNREFCTFFC